MPNKARQSEIHALIQRADAADAAFMNGDAAGSFAMNRHSTAMQIRLSQG